MPLARLLGIVLQHYYATLNESLHPLGLSAGQVPVILSLAACQNVTQEALARHFQVDKGAVARAARRLEESGFIRREIDPADRRAVRLFLTERGEQVVPELRRLGSAWEAAVMDGLDASERAAFRSTLARMAGARAGGGRCHE
jgi:DNA-binding MarR family transcriptional regulator